MLSDAYATYLSGTGPTVMTLLPKGKASQFNERLNSHGLSGEIVALTVDTQGLIVLD